MLRIRTILLAQLLVLGLLAAEPAGGRSGGGLAIGDEPQALAIPEGTGAERGTLSFWFSPHDWDNRMIFGIHHPKYVVPLIRGLYRDPASDELQDLFQIAVFRMSEIKGGTPWIRYPVQPGTWYHLTFVWDGNRQRLLINGEPADEWTFRVYYRRDLPADAPLERLEFGHPGWWRSSGRTGGIFRDPVSTLVDQVQLFGRALTPPELENLYHRDLPGSELTPLPQAYSDIRLNQHRQRLEGSFELLSPKREQVGAVTLDLEKTDGSQQIKATITDFTNGRADIAQELEGELYGDYSGQLTFLDADGAVIERQPLAVSHPAPPWYGNTLGLHPGDVLPGWQPIRVAEDGLSMLERSITLDGRGWPSRLTSPGGAVVERPVRLELEGAAGPIALRATAEQPAIVEAADDIVVLRGEAARDGWRLVTTTTVEFDGFMKVEARLEGPPEQSLKRFQVDIPLSLGDGQFVGFWAGDRNFRAACDYRPLPAADGVVFRSNATGRKQREGWEERVSFLPFLSVTGDERGIMWLAENDRNWSRSWSQPAQEIIREGGTTWLRLTLVHAEEPLPMNEARTFTFAMQATPVRPPAMNERPFASRFHFGMVDGFNGHTITADYGGHGDFRLAPEGMDWEGVERRAVGARDASPGELLMYLDRNWQRAPDDAMEFNSDWRGWGGAVAYTPVVRDTMAWYQNEYLRRGLVDGFYIDDCWTRPTKGHAPAYSRDGERQWGFSFYDFRESLKRLRWLFHDNDMEPRIVLHVTQTLYMPVFVFGDLLIDGEARFPKWGQKADFIAIWSPGRIRYNAPGSLGMPTVWMNAIGNKEPAPGAMPRWHYRQQRSFVGLCAASGVWPLSDSTGALARDLAAAGCNDAAATFLGYWDDGLPIAAPDAAIKPALYRLPDRLALVVLNTAHEERVSELTLDLETLRQWLGGGQLTITDMDNSDVPEGEDVREFKEAAAAVEVGEESNQAADLLGDLEADIDAEEAAAADPFSHLDSHNFERDGEMLRLRIRPRDYRLLQITTEDAP